MSAAQGGSRGAGGGRPRRAAPAIKKGTLLRILLRGEMGAENVLQDEPMARHCSFRVGGPADWLLRANDAEALTRAVYAARRTDLPYRVIGGGSNILVADEGIEGIVILNRARGYELIRYHGGYMLVAESGVMLPRLAGELAREGAAGLEWGVGVPGTVGGAVVQNAGAWGEEIKDRLLSIEYIMPDNDRVKTIAAERLGLRYRGSNILDAPPQRRPIIVRAWFRLDREAPEAVRERLTGYSQERSASQPRAASGGSTFRNPPGDYAGRLLEAAGLKGHRVGDAGFSEKHANFIVNYGGATAKEIRKLIELGRLAVESQFGTRLVPEIEFVGRWEQAATGADDE